jgi:hypothetical protein
MSSPAATHGVRKLPRYDLYGALIGAVLFGAAGGGYGVFLHFNPEYREALIRERLSKPHPDSRRYVASIQAIRYQSLTELLLRNTVAPLLTGGFVGAVVGTVVRRSRARREPAARVVGPPFKMVEILVVASIVVLLIAWFNPGPRDGLVFYEGRDQFYWLDQLEYGDPPARDRALNALCTLLEGRPFPCRATIVAAIAEIGEDGATAVPVLTKLARSEEEGVRNAAVEALKRLRPASAPSRTSDPNRDPAEAPGNEEND